MGGHLADPRWETSFDSSPPPRRVDSLKGFGIRLRSAQVLQIPSTRPNTNGPGRPPPSRRRRVRPREHIVSAICFDIPRKPVLLTIFQPSSLSLASFSLWTRPLLIPSYFVLASIIALVVQAIISSDLFKQLRARIIGTVENEDEGAGAGADESSADSSTRTGLVSAVTDHVERSGGSVIFLFQFLRLILVLALLSLSIYSFIREEEQEQSGVNSGLPVDTLMRSGKRGRKKHKHKHRNDGDTLSEREWIDLAFCLNYVRGAPRFARARNPCSHYHLSVSRTPVSWRWSRSRPGERVPRSHHSISPPCCSSPSPFTRTAIFGHSLLSR